MEIVKLKQAYIQQTDGTSILQNVDLSIAPGEFVYLVGKTGSGKSSLIRTLHAALPLAGGEGEVAGFFLHRLKKTEIPLLRRKIGVIFQDFQLLTDRTVLENLLFVLEATGWKDKQAMLDRSLHVLASVGLEDKAYTMPYALSGGEQQRVTVARALLNSPALILADEPTGNLDPETSDDILSLLRKLSESYQVAVLCATHDYRIIQNFPARVLRLQKGKILSEEAVG
jgi:cell division transport system ATP-binding protein